MSERVIGVAIKDTVTGQVWTRPLPAIHADLLGRVVSNHELAYGFQTDLRAWVDRITAFDLATGSAPGKNLVLVAEKA
jgi:hypothetical protein